MFKMFLVEFTETGNGMKDFDSLSITTDIKFVVNVVEISTVLHYYKNMIENTQIVITFGDKLC